MTRRTAADVEAAKLLLAHESARSGSAEDRAAAAVRVYERLAERLSPLIGAAGMRALLARSLKLTKPEFPCFQDVVVAVEPADDPPPSEQLLACLSKLEPEETSEAAVALFGTVLGILTGLIGERLVLQALRSAFPAMDQNVSKETER